MGMSSRTVLLLGVAGLGALALLADRTLVDRAGESISDLGGVVREVQKAQAIAASLDDGGPTALQALFDTLAENQGVTPGYADADLFGSLTQRPSHSLGDGGMPEGTPGAAAGTAPPAQHPSAASPRAVAHRVTMVLTGPRGGMALIDGRPLATGETHGGLTLLAVREDGVSIRERDETRFIALSDASR